MKIHFTLTLLLLFFIGNSYAQGKSKDTLFFSIDKYYTVSPTITTNLSNQTYPELEETHREQMKQTKTNGYIFFVGDGFLTKGLKPKKVLSIKDYIEKKQFYLDGKYNRIIDKWKLKDSLVDKYIIFFVNGGEFIQPRSLEYYSYYPLRDKDWNVINNNIKDTLYFKLDNNYVYQSKYDSKAFLFKDSHDVDYGAFYFERVLTFNNLKPKRRLLFEEFVQNSRFYNSTKKEKLDDYGLWDYLSQYVIFLVIENKKTEYFQVNPVYAIE
jgi:hypothetical protein